MVFFFKKRGRVGPFFKKYNNVILNDTKWLSLSQLKIYRNHIWLEKDQNKATYWMIRNYELIQSDSIAVMVLFECQASHNCACVFVFSLWAWICCSIRSPSFFLFQHNTFSFTGDQTQDSPYDKRLWSGLLDCSAIHETSLWLIVTLKTCSWRWSSWTLTQRSLRTTWSKCFSTSATSCRTTTRRTSRWSSWLPKAFRTRSTRRSPPTFPRLPEAS